MASLRFVSASRIYKKLSPLNSLKTFTDCLVGVRAQAQKLAEASEELISAVLNSGLKAQDKRFKTVLGDHVCYVPSSFCVRISGETTTHKTEMPWLY